MVEHLFRLLAPTIYVLLLTGALFVDLASWRSSRAAYLLCGKRGILTLCAAHADRWGWAILCGVWIVDCLPAQSRGVELLIVAYLLCGFALIVAGGVFSLWRWRRSEEPVQVARGAFCDGVEALRRKAGLERAPSIYILPDGHIAPSGHHSYGTPWGVNIRMPRRFLDWLSRGEIDALVALQLPAGQGRVRPRRVVVAALVCGLAAAAIISSPKLGASRVEVFLLLLAVELLALILLWPRLQSQTDRRAIEIAGDPDVFLSAMVKLYRLAGVAPGQRYLSRLASTAGIAPERLRTLLQEELRPAEDRYPTSGDYMAVGF